MSRIKLVSACMFSMLLIATGARGDERPDYITTPMYIEHSASSPNLWETIDDLRSEARKCIDTNSACRSIVESLEQAFGIPVGSTKKSMEAVDSVGLGPEIAVYGQQKDFWLPPLDGYYYCKVGVYADSGGSNPGEMWVSAKFDYIRVLTHVDNPNITQQKRYVSAWIIPTQVRNDLYSQAYADGKCNIWSCWNAGVTCKGAGCGAFPELQDYPPLTTLYRAPNCAGKIL